MTHPSHIRLCDAPLGRHLRIKRLGLDPDLSARLREMGICEEGFITCLARSHGGIICQVFSTKIGLNGHLAGSIVVSASE
jgi:Fe2+ transport system protein FeoA